MKKTYADICLERAEKVRKGPWVIETFSPIVIYDVPELARRLKRACEYIRDLDFDSANKFADELERTPGG